MVLQFGIPGGPELLVILLIAIFLFGLPILLIAVVGFLYLRSDGDDYDERIRELEAEIARLEAKVGANGDSDATTGTGDTSPTDDVSTADRPATDNDSGRHE